MENSPLVSCIMPCSRPEDLPTAISLFERQDYPNKQLIICFDEPFGFLNENENIVTIVSRGSNTIGDKRNACCENADGEIILHLDSDDWYAADWISRSVTFLNESEAELVGINSAFFYQPHSQAWQYSFPEGCRMPYVIGASMCYYKETWKRVGGFKDISTGEDAHFCAAVGAGTKAHDYHTGFVAMITGKNTASHKQLNKMYRLSPLAVKTILGDDAGLY